MLKICKFIIQVESSGITVRCLIKLWFIQLIQTGMQFHLIMDCVMMAPNCIAKNTGRNIYIHIFCWNFYNNYLQVIAVVYKSKFFNSLCFWSTCFTSKNPAVRLFGSLTEWQSNLSLYVHGPEYFNEIRSILWLKMHCLHVFSYHELSVF